MPEVATAAHTVECVAQSSSLSSTVGAHKEILMVRSSHTLWLHAKIIGGQNEWRKVPKGGTERGQKWAKVDCKMAK